NNEIKYESVVSRIKDNKKSKVKNNNKQSTEMLLAIGNCERFHSYSSFGLYSRNPNNAAIKITLTCVKADCHKSVPINANSAIALRFRSGVNFFAMPMI